MVRACNVTQVRSARCTLNRGQILLNRGQILLKTNNNRNSYHGACTEMNAEYHHFFKFMIYNVMYRYLYQYFFFFRIVVHASIYEFFDYFCISFAMQ